MQPHSAADTTAERATGTTAAPMQQPTPPFPPQHQDGTGLESRLHPAPRYQAARYRPAGKLEGQVALIPAAIPASAARWR